MPEVNGIDLDEALRLIRQHMMCNDTIGKMFMRTAKALEGCGTPFASTLSGEEARERLRQINRHVYDSMATLHDVREADHG